MKPNVEFPKKVKNSFIFFQLGLIATMLVVLFVLEFNFELKAKQPVASESIPTFTIQVPTDFRIIPHSKPLALKPAVTTPKFKDAFKSTDKEVPKEKITPVETSSAVETDSPKETVQEKPITESPALVPVDATPFNVEELPMFPACKGLSRSEQVKCFEEQMSKAVAKNTVYPESDLESGKQGRALISFIIDETGKIVEVKALDSKSATKEMQKAAVIAVKKVSKLIPAKQGGKPVRIKYSIPVTFRIQ
jgi:TonB family protein